MLLTVDQFTEAYLSLEGKNTVLFSEEKRFFVPAGDKQTIVFFVFL